MKKYYNGVVIKDNTYLIVDVRNFKNGKGYEILSEEEFLSPDRDFLDENRKYIYVLNYSSLKSFLSNNLGATDDLKINKPFTVYFIDDKKIALEINNEYFFIRDEITPSKYEIETLAARFDANSKYVNSVLNVEPEEFIGVIKSEKTLKLTK